MFEEGNILDIFTFFRIKNDTFGGERDICEPAALSVLSVFERINPHYTYTLPQVNHANEYVNEEVEELEETGQTEEDEDENEPRFVSIS